MTELNEQQFYFLKGLAEQGIHMMIVPATNDADTQEMTDSWNRNFGELEALKTMGFLDDITEKYEDAQETAVKQTGRRFYAFHLTPVAIQMFGPKEGLAN